MGAAHTQLAAPLARKPPAWTPISTLGTASTRAWCPKGESRQMKTTNDTTARDDQKAALVIRMLADHRLPEPAGKLATEFPVLAIEAWPGQHRALRLWLRALVRELAGAADASAPYALLARLALRFDDLALLEAAAGLLSRELAGDVIDGGGADGLQEPATGVHRA